MRIRTLRTEDYNYIINRVNDWWGGRNMAPGLPSLFLEHFAGTSLAAEDDQGRIIGFVVGFMSPQHPDEAYIHYTGVEPAHHGRGIGSSLYEAFYEIARQNGRSRVSCITSPVNKASIAYHTRIGFEILPSSEYEEGVPVHRGHNGPGKDMVLFQKRI